MPTRKAAATAAIPASADKFNFRMASGHAPATGYVRMMSEQFAPRVKAKLAAMGHKATFNEAYGGSIVKVAEVTPVEPSVVVVHTVSNGICFTSLYKESGVVALAVGLSALYKITSEARLGI